MRKNFSISVACLTFLCVLLWGNQGKERENLYSAFGKRDPFRVPDIGGVAGREVAMDPLRKFRLEGYRLRAILRAGGKTQAMFEDPEGKSHVVEEGALVGLEGARVSRIVNSEVIVTERSVNYLNKETLLERVISLPSNAEGKDEGPVPSQSVQPAGPSAAAKNDSVKNEAVVAPVAPPPTENAAVIKAEPEP